jgi:hypothetical protein
MKTSLARTNAILSFEAAADLTGYVGHFVVLAAGKAALVGSATTKPLGVLLTDGKAGERVSVAIGAGGLAGTIRVKLAATVSTAGIDLQLTADGRVQTDAGSGARTVVAQSLEPGAVDELIEAVLFRPVALT